MCQFQFLLFSWNWSAKNVYTNWLIWKKLIFFQRKGASKIFFSNSFSFFQMPQRMAYHRLHSISINAILKGLRCIVWVRIYIWKHFFHLIKQLICFVRHQIKNEFLTNVFCCCCNELHFALQELKTFLQKVNVGCTLYKDTILFALNNIGCVT